MVIARVWAFSTADNTFLLLLLIVIMLPAETASPLSVPLPLPRSLCLYLRTTSSGRGEEDLFTFCCGVQTSDSAGLPTRGNR